MQLVTQTAQIHREDLPGEKIAHANQILPFVDTDKKFLFASFPQLARAVLSRGALKGELLVRVRNMGRISSRSTSF